MDYSEFQKDVTFKCENFILNLHSKNNITRKDVSNIQKDVSSILQSITEPIKSSQPFSDSNHSLSNFLSFCQNPFRNIETEYKFFKSISNSNQFAKPLLFNVHNEICEIILDGTPSLDASKVKGCLMPLNFQFKKFFELPTVLLTTLENAKNLSNISHITHCLNSSSFKKKVDLYSEKTIIPYYLYIDDFEINNPLGSHATVDSICGVYYNFPSLPQHLLSKLDFIFVAAYFKSNEQKIFGNASFLQPLVKELIKLQNEGVVVETDGGCRRVHFILANILGDNLGLNNVLGFTTSFNSNFYCRFCTRQKSDMCHDGVEHTNHMRNKENYTSALNTKDVKLTGIKAECLFNQLDSFHAAQNFSADIAHDLYEGVCNYDLCEVLLHFISSKTYSIEVFNYRKQMFNYGPTEIGNFSPPIQINNLKNYKIKMSAREMMTFVHFLPLIIGDLIPINNPVWKFFINLLKIVDILNLSDFNDDLLEKLDSLIRLHNETFVLLFEKPLKPKFHFLVHYSTIIRNSGPLKNLQCLRFESKHREAKTYARNISSRKNISYSLSMKSSLKFTSVLKKYATGLPNDVQAMKLYTFNIEKSEFFGKIEINNELKQRFDNNLAAVSVIFKGSTYKKSYFVTQSYNNNVLLYKIKNIIISNENCPYFIVSQLTIIEFNEHLQSYKVGLESDFVKIININKFTGPPIHLAYMSDGSQYFRNKTF